MFSVYAANKKLKHISDIQIERSLENFAYRFSCSMVPQDLQFRAGDAIQVFWREEELGKGKDPIFSGYIDRVQLWLDGKAVRYSATIEARSYAVDLIDSVDSMAAFSASLSDVCKKVCKIYGVKFEDTTKKKGKEKARFALEQQSPFEVLDQLAREQGAILATNGPGGLELAERKSDMLNKSSPFTLENILDVNYTHDISRCYHRYSGSIGGARLWEKDPNIRPSRVLEMEGESIGSLRARLQNEKRRRRGLSERLRFTVQGWKAPDHETHYYENSNIWVDMPELGIEKQQFFLYAVTLRLSRYGGYRTELSCCRKEAFMLADKGKSAGTTKPFREPVVFLRKDKSEKR